MAIHANAVCRNVAGTSEYADYKITPTEVRTITTQADHYLNKYLPEIKDWLRFLDKERERLEQHIRQGSDAPLLNDGRHRDKLLAHMNSDFLLDSVKWSRGKSYSVLNLLLGR